MVMRFLAFIAILLLCLADGGSTFAAKKKKQQPPAKPKAVYESPMTVVIVRSNNPACEPLCPEWISAEGDITDGTPARFRQAFKQMGKKQLPIIIRSPGGSINAALEIGRMIRKRKLDVAVGRTFFTGCTPYDKTCKLPKEQKGVYRGWVGDYEGYCSSACPLILAGGGVRLAKFGGRVGLHKPRSESWQERVYYRETYRIVNGKKKVLKRTVTGRKRVNHRVSYEYSKALRKKLAGYYKEMGVDPAIMDDSVKAEYKDMHWLPAERMDALKLRTSAESSVALVDADICKGTQAAGNCVAGKPIESTAKSEQVALAVKPEPAMPPMQFKIVRSGELGCMSRCVEWISAEGRILVGSVARLKALLDEEPFTNRFIVLNSDGGSLEGALRLGRLIRERKIAVIVGSNNSRPCNQFRSYCWFEGKALFEVGAILRKGTCSGTCPLVLAAGAMRIAERTLLTSARSLASTVPEASVISQIKAYLREMEVGEGLLHRMQKLKNGEFQELDLAAMVAIGLVNSTIDIEYQDESAECTNQKSPAICVRR